MISLLDLAFPAGVSANDDTYREVLLVYETKPNPPRYLGSGTGIDWEKPGLTLELFKLMEERLPVKFIFKRVPWKRGLYLVQTDQADGIFHASFKKERERLGVYPMKNGIPDHSRAVLVQNYVFYVRRSASVSWDGRILSHFEGNVGVPGGYSILDDLEKMGLPVEESKNHEINFTKLIGNRISVVADLENMADIYLERNRKWGDHIVKLSPPVKTKAYFLIFSHGFYDKNGELAQRIWNAIPEINASKRFRDLVKQYSKQNTP